MKLCQKNHIKANKDILLWENYYQQMDWLKMQTLQESHTRDSQQNNKKIKASEDILSWAINAVPVPRPTPVASRHSLVQYRVVLCQAHTYIAKPTRDGEREEGKERNRERGGERIRWGVEKALQLLYFI